MPLWVIQDKYGLPLINGIGQVKVWRERGNAQAIAFESGTALAVHAVHIVDADEETK